MSFFNEIVGGETLPPDEFKKKKIQDRQHETPFQPFISLLPASSTGG
jgi:hypothetical protein